MGDPFLRKGLCDMCEILILFHSRRLFIVLRRTANLNPEPINLNPYFFALSSSSFFSSLSFGRRT